jgi:ParB-like chromosome segregation protein Spo0J
MLTYKLIPTSDLIPYARNSRTHSEAQVTKIASSIKEFGFINPVVTDGKNGIVAGHGRVLAANKLGLKEVPCVEASHLTEAQKRAYVIADNRMALDAGWDFEMLKVELKDLEDMKFDLTMTGFDLGEMASMFAEPNFEAGTEADQGKLDELAPKIIQCPHCGDEFDMRKHEQG